MTRYLFAKYQFGAIHTADITDFRLTNQFRRIRDIPPIMPARIKCRLKGSEYTFVQVAGFLHQIRAKLSVS